MMELVISEPGVPPRVVPLSKTTLSLGRSTENDLAYPNDPWLSRFHLNFEFQGVAWTVKDCASRNGTVINTSGLKEPQPIKSGDKIFAGHLTIEVREPEARKQSQVISFVPEREDKVKRETTIVTSLEKVLKKTDSDVGQPRDSVLATRRVVQALVRAGQELSVHRPLEQLFAVILDLSLSAVEAKRGVILTLENEELVVRASQGVGFSISTSVRDRVIREKASIVLGDAQADDAFRQQHSIVMHQVRSMMAVPLQTGERVIGLIYVDNGSVIRPFSQEDLDLLTVMANVAAIRIEHARLAAVEQAERLTQYDLAQASELQQSLLPSIAPAYEGYDLAGFNLPCRTVGGDYYDFLPYRDGRLGLIVGDVSGKGMPAALLMASLQARVQMLVETSPDPGAAVTALNRNLAERSLPGRFITFFYGLLDVTTGRLRYSNAGHNYPILLHADDTVEELSASGIVLGILPHIYYDVREADIQPGELLALYSDGVTESRSLDGEEFGEARLTEFLKDHRSLRCSEIASALVEHLRHWQSGSHFADDFTIVLLKRL